MSDSVVNLPRRRGGRRRKPDGRSRKPQATRANPLSGYDPRELPTLEFAEELPISAARERIAQAIARAPVVIVCGETGSGKTTQLPKICAMLGRGAKARIGHTQPRRLAASSVANRIAQELGSPIGTDVGYKVRFSEQMSKTARFKLMTDGILLAETQHDPLLRQYDTIIVDEAHERSLNIDFLLGYLKRLVDGPRREDLKLIITSATIDAQRFADHFGCENEPAPVIEVSGRLYPVDIRYETNSAASGDKSKHGRLDDEDDDSDLPARIEWAINELWRKGSGDILVFLPGEREIRDAAEHLNRALQHNGKIGGGARSVEIVPLMARLSPVDQQRVFSPSNGRRVVLATNVAETSITVPGIRYVVDTGLARVKRYRWRGKVEQLQIEPISQAAANQRAGRCGRVADGICIRLYDEAEFPNRATFTDPEILRSSLATVILRMTSMKLGSVEQFPFLDAPSGKAITDGYALLTELGAVDDKRELTTVGAQLARLPLDPKVARMLLAGEQAGCLRETLIISSALSVQDPRDRPMAMQQAADQAHKPFIDSSSDFLSLLRIWRFWRDAERNRQSGGESRGQLRRRLEKMFLSPRRLREWGDLHQQLAEAVRDLGWHVSNDDAKPEVIHKALLFGLLGNLGNKAPEEKQYQGTHQIRFNIHPSSALTRKPPRWLMAAEMVDTSRLFARVVAPIQPSWVEAAAGHLIRRSWSEPVWSGKAGQAIVFERGVLYGLPIYTQRRIPLSTQNPVLAREMFVRFALADRDWNPGRDKDRLGFLNRNQKLIKSIEALEHQIRRPDLLVDPQFLFEWFDARVPESVVNGRQFVQWYAEASRKDKNLLVLSRKELLRKDAAGVDSDDFPRQLRMGGVDYGLAYRFEPGADDDGVTLTVPLSLLNQLDADRCDWLVPGLLTDKVARLVKSLPQRMRRKLVPLPTYAQDFVDRHPEQKRQQPLLEALRLDMREHYVVLAQISDFRPDTVPTHFSMNFRLLDAHGRQLGLSRNLMPLRSRHAQQARGAFREAFAAVAADIDKGATKNAQNKQSQRQAEQQAQAASKGLKVDAQGDVLDVSSSARFTHWPVDGLPEIMEIHEPVSGASIVGFPALVDHGDAVGLEVFDEQETAKEKHRAGVRRLLAIALKQSLKSMFSGLPNYQALVIAYARIGTDEGLKSGLTAAILDRACIDQEVPDSRAKFDASLLLVKPRIGLIGHTTAGKLTEILAEYGVTARKLQAVRVADNERYVGSAMEDIRTQLQALIFDGFVGATPAEQFNHLPRYLKGITVRIEQVRADPERGERFRVELDQFTRALQRLRRDRRGAHDAELDRLRWLIEELRISLFAQRLRTPMPVSVKRLNKILNQLRQ